jgi:hypothetical protein
MAIEGVISSANCALRLYRMSSRAHDQICAFETVFDALFAQMSDKPLNR